MSAITLLLFVIGLVLLLAGAELLVRGASRLAAAVGISPLVIGLTVVAFGTSAPELAVSARGALAGQADIALGNVLGSNIFNVLAILGFSALVAPLVVAQQLVRWDVPLMIGASLLVGIFALDGDIGPWQGLVLAGGAVAYTVLAVRKSRRESAQVAAEYAAELAPATATRKGGLLGDLLLIAVGLGMLVVGSGWLVDGAVGIARFLGLSDLVIGLTVIAAGTSLPELATSMVAAARGERDIAVGNVVGSNLFNLLIVLGAAAMLSPGGIQVAPGALRFDVPVMIAVAVACLPIFYTGHRIDRWEGALFVGYYAAYVVYLVLRATEHDAAELFRAALLWFALPLTAVTLALLVVRSLRRGRP